MRKTARLLMVSHSTISRWIHSPERTKYIRQSRLPLKGDAIVDIVRCTIKADPFASVVALKHKIAETLGITVSKELVRIAIKKQGLTRKLAYFYGAPKTLPEKTTEFLRRRQAFSDQGRKFASIDETSFGRNGDLARGYETRGKKLHVERKPASVKTLSVVACCTEEGWTNVTERPGSFDSKTFANFVDSLNLRPGTVVPVDNVSFHHSQIVLDAFKRKQLDGLFVPPYSPWFNPIEMCFSLVKRAYYKTTQIEESFRRVKGEPLRTFSINARGARSDVDETRADARRSRQIFFTHM